VQPITSFLLLPKPQAWCHYFFPCSPKSFSLSSPSEPSPWVPYSFQSPVPPLLNQNVSLPDRSLIPRCIWVVAISNLHLLQQLVLNWNSGIEPLIKSCRSSCLPMGGRANRLQATTKNHDQSSPMLRRRRRRRSRGRSRITLSNK